MGYGLFATEAFERDHDETLAYLVYNLGAPQAAARFMDVMDASIAKIGENPFANAISRKPTLDFLEYREERVGGYVMLYRVEDERVVIKRLFHATQDYERYV